MQKLEVCVRSKGVMLMRAGQLQGGNGETGYGGVLKQTQITNK